MISIPNPPLNTVGKDIPASGSAGSGVSVPEGGVVGVAVAVPVGVDVGVGESDGVLVGVSVGVGDGDPMVNASVLQEVICGSAAAGSLSGAAGETDSCLRL